LRDAPRESRGARRRGRPRWHGANPPRFRFELLDNHDPKNLGCRCPESSRCGMRSKHSIRLALHGLGKLSERVQHEIIWIIRVEFGPIVTAAGARLRIIPAVHSHGDLNIDFDSDSPPGKVCGATVLGEDAAGVIYVKAHRELRVCGKADAHGKRDTRRFLTTDVLLGRALANSAIHELGHFIADLDHASDAHNYMMTFGIPRANRTLRTQRQTWAGKQSFTPEQKHQLVTQLRARRWLGDLQVN
jgi:hypothetical protein